MYAVQPSPNQAKPSRQRQYKTETPPELTDKESRNLLISLCLVQVYHAGGCPALPASAGCTLVLSGTSIVGAIDLGCASTT